MVSPLEKLLGTPRDGALLRYSLGLEYQKAGQLEQALAHLREAVRFDPLYSAAWKTLGRVLADLPVELKRPRAESMLGEPAFVQAADGIWQLIRAQAQAALRE